MKKILTILAVCVAAPGFAQTPATQAPPAVTVTGSVTQGVTQVDNNSNSSKLTEYRDLDDAYVVKQLAFDAFDAGSRWYFTLGGVNVGRADQTIDAVMGGMGRWRLSALWNETPHNYSNKALTPYTQTSPGVFEVPATIPVTFKKLATAAADTAGVVATDDLVAAYQAQFLHATPLAVQTRQGHFGFDWFATDALKLAVAFDRQTKQGLKSTFGPIGDRPPRTLNVQLTEPVDTRTSDITLALEHEGSGYQLRAEYLYSDFANGIDTLRWENVWASALPGASYDVWDRAVATYGARPLAPDNRYHNATFSGGLELPYDSRLTATAAYGRMEQDATLLPYATVDIVANKTLPRQTADASINTFHVAADYVIAPAPGLNLRAFYRQYDLTNDTPSGNWQYVTSDTPNVTGTVSFVNKRVSLPVAWDRQNVGADLTWRLPARSSLMFGYEREAMGRDHREADTTEQMFRATLRMKPATWMTLQGRYVYGLRDGGEYDNEVTHEGYWYTQADGVDNNNPALTFDNHPDMRRFDVSDRTRQQLDVRVNLTPRDLVAISAYVRYRKDDFDSEVAPSQPLLGTGLAEQAATTPGDQLGWLEDTRLRYGVDVFMQPSSRVTLNAFVAKDAGTSFHRSLEFNENNKANPSGIATAELGPWTRAGSQWTADFDDQTVSGGVGATLQLVPEKVALIADYTMSLADIDIVYEGFGVTNYNGAPFAANHQFAFSTPPAITEDQQVLNVRLEFPVKAFTAIVGYSYETYSLTDWQQGSNQPWVESVGADTFLRDTSRSFQWGNRLFNLGTYLAPSYDAHMGFVGLRYRF
ncbi:MAG: MtrB/PioB family outer membrane beta-barrel protein [Acidobacteria bacterium]|nr:MtrB/PioB family outer membrane beta-barrel protein [Acidobacteriota bacterium]